MAVIDESGLTEWDGMLNWMETPQKGEPVTLVTVASFKQKICGFAATRQPKTSFLKRGFPDLWPKLYSGLEIAENCQNLFLAVHDHFTRPSGRAGR